MIFNNKNATLILAKNQNNKNLTKSIYARFQFLSFIIEKKYII